MFIVPAEGFPAAGGGAVTGQGLEALGAYGVVHLYTSWLLKAPQLLYIHCNNKDDNLSLMLMRLILALNA